MTERYAKNYRILGIQPKANWKQLRQAYRSLVNTWHPDRFQQDVRQRKLAEEKTKEITQSYKELADYYKKFGALPHVTETLEIPVAENIASQNASGVHPPPESQDTEPYDAVVKNARTQKSSLSRLHTQTIAAVALAGAAYFIWQMEPQENHNNPPASMESTDKVADTQKDENSNHHTPDEKYFAVGSSIGEVYTVQGVPTNTEKNIWYYGKSKVYFGKGKVLRWEESADNPLRIKMPLEIDKPSMAFFGKGSSKEEVMALQGAPDRDAGNVWDYGISRVYFENDRVTGWNETSFNPLKVRR
jgi:hypothetical protein